MESTFEISLTVPLDQWTWRLCVPDGGGGDIRFRFFLQLHHVGHSSRVEQFIHLKYSDHTFWNQLANFVKIKVTPFKNSWFRGKQTNFF